MTDGLRVHGRIRSIKVMVEIEEDDGRVSVWEAAGVPRKGSTQLLMEPDYTPEPQGSWHNGTAPRGRREQPAITDGVGWAPTVPERVKVQMDTVLRPIAGVPLYVEREGERGESPPPPKHVIYRLTDLGGATP